MRQRDDYKRKMNDLETQMDQLKAVGGGGLVKKMTRLGRPVLQENQNTI